MKVNAVFEGGGVKAVALAGAVQAAEENGIGFYRMAGTSSGSLVASLLSAGYTSAELRQLITETPFESFLQRSWMHKFKYVGPAVRLFYKKGLFSGKALEQWVDEKLAAKGLRTFGDLPDKRLRIIASDITNGRLLVLPDDIAQYGVDPKRFRVARAVRMSTSIPYFFDPVVLRKPAGMRKKGERFAEQFVYIVDGGLLSNFPMWLFDEDPELSRMGLQTVGFQLVGQTEGQPRRITGPITMFGALFSTMLDARDERYIEKPYRSRTIKIPTHGVSTTDFDLKPAKSDQLYEAGVKAGREFFAEWLSNNGKPPEA
ncbi:patatin-like phospholipase family protein [Paenibacillus thermoaerophilus]|uniref:Patatin-like phospholipase family protein n=1 Tax=Paenibacillus thermoaerophilus TaxID=1215385 RepID=A0ABW2V538_9BACL|nr:patatin-like phospholipase family protein [Paenibacillus thermoaerophilus]TMV18803.1 patatin-like phospholipase family protein [Paenibacillus thermoaerophilus]